MASRCSSSLCAIAVAALLFLCGASTPESSPTSRPAASPALAFRLVADQAHSTDEPVDLLTDPSAPPEGAKLRVCRKVLLDESAIARVNPSFDPETGRCTILMTMTPEGGRRLREITTANQNRRLAVVIDGQLIIAPTIAGVIADRVMIDCPGMDVEQMRALSRRIQAAILSLPTSRPASSGGK